MTYEYKWYIIRANYSCEHDIRALVNCEYFKEIFVPYKTVRSGVCEIYAYMYLCDASKSILSKIHGLCDDGFEIIPDDEVDAKRKEFAKYEWYLLRVASNYEEKVRQYMLENSARLGISDYFKEIYIPYEEPGEMELRSKKTAIRKKHCPGYVFLYVNLCDAVLNFINNIPKSLKVYGFLKDGNMLKAISNDDINAMCSRIYTEQETKNLSYGFERGEKVKITEGTFQNFTGIVDAIDEVNDEKSNERKEIVSVKISIFGKPTVLKFNLAQIEKVEE
ncbi:transcription termination/antitermination factor NusG [Wolbachia pipientis]|uniref:Transcription termination/antitermination protein NusG n=1 Tax=Wolbachia pipientis TaxID=955 RepID=A0A1E7QK12_WOLPI|nr:transcription termination/antitermination protein NusG [Wolbachia pipientis]OEY86801.1 transcription termination/antitermination factor NusG [Wolbachia pipientis]